MRGGGYCDTWQKWGERTSASGSVPLSWNLQTGISIETGNGCLLSDTWHTWPGGGASSVSSLQLLLDWGRGLFCVTLQLQCYHELLLELSLAEPITHVPYVSSKPLHFQATVNIWNWILMTLKVLPVWNISLVDPTKISVTEHRSQCHLHPCTLLIGFDP